MKYDPNFPLTLNSHVIMDRRSGTQNQIKEHSAAKAMVRLLQDFQRPDFDALSTAHQKEVTDFMSKSVMSMLGGSELERPSDGILRVGPFETQDKCIHMKNMMLVEMQLAANPATKDLADWVSSEFLTDEAESDDPVGDRIGEMLEKAFGGEAKVIRVPVGGLGDLFGGRRSEPSLADLLGSIIGRRR